MEHKRIVIQKDADPADENRRAGRPRSGEAHAAILDAAVALIREVGYDAVTMDGIAARAGVGKATVYRRWKGKEALVVEAIGRIVAALPVPDTGDTRANLLAAMRDTLALYQDPASGALLSGLVAAMARSEPIARVIRTGFVAARNAALRQVLERGVSRGELRFGVDTELALDLLNAPLFYRYLLTGEPVDEPLVDAVVDAVMRALAPE